MRKLLFAVNSLVIVGMTSCKKEEGVQEVNNRTVLDKKDNSTSY